MKFLPFIGWVIAILALALLVGTADYKYALEQENAKLKDKISRMIDPPSLVDPICPSGIWYGQRYDKRNKRGVIVESRWKRTCIEQKEM